MSVASHRTRLSLKKISVVPDSSTWFFDSVTLSNFALAAGLPVISVRYRGRGFATTQVVAELTRGVAAGYAPLADALELLDQDVLHIVSLDLPERNTYRHIMSHLGEGEAGTISAAYHRRGIVVSDDLAARRTCADMDIPVTGTIGILRAAVRDRELSLSDANSLLVRMIKAGFHSPVRQLT